MVCRVYCGQCPGGGCCCVMGNRYSCLLVLAPVREQHRNDTVSQNGISRSRISSEYRMDNSVIDSPFFPEEVYRIFAYTPDERGAGRILLCVVNFVHYSFLFRSVFDRVAPFFSLFRNQSLRKTLFVKAATTRKVFKISSLFYVPEHFPGFFRRDGISFRDNKRIDRRRSAGLAGFI